ncbi:MAG TPA: hypothetical protein VF384_12945 [Planctomycetota bacterium]
MKSFRLALITLCSFASVCSAQFIPGVTATSSMGTFSTYNIANLTNGVGLSSMTLSGLHSATWQDMWITNQITTGSITFNLGSVVPIAVIAVWNYNSSISLQRGVALMDVYTSVDGVNFTFLSTEAPPMATAAPVGPHLIGGNGVPAQYVRFDVLQNYGNNYTGLSEVQFEPGSGVTVGSNTTLGQGCIRSFTSFYESFATSAAFDLANSAMSMVPVGGGSYIVLSGATSYVAPSAGAVALTLADNAETPVPLAIPFPHAGGSAASLVVCSNGFVSVASGNGVSSAPTATTLLNAPQTGWWAAHNYNPAAAGSGVVKVEQIAGTAYITWDGVYSSGTTTPSTFQFQFDCVSGAVHLVFQTMSTLGNARLVGYSPGGTSLNPGNTDLSAALPGSFTTGTTDILPLTLSGTTRPVIGTPWNLNVTNVPATGVIGLDIFGLIDPSIPDLFFLGAPGCCSRSSLDVMNLWIVAGSTHAYSLPLANDPAIVGVHVYTQALVLQPGVNLLLGGAITSNGIDGKVGNL